MWSYTKFGYLNSRLSNTKSVCKLWVWQQMFAARMLYAIKSFLIKKKCGNSSKSLVLWPNGMYGSSSGSSLCCCGYYYFIIFYANISAFCVIAFTRCGHSGRQQYAYVPTYLCGSLTCPWSCVVLCCVLSCPVLSCATQHSSAEAFLWLAIVPAGSTGTLSESRNWANARVRTALP